jgi:glutathione gamma-glutamylcysteinyltransferase
MEAYFHLAEQYSTQSHPAFCGIGSLTVALNALLVDPRRVWKGVWRSPLLSPLVSHPIRWFDDTMLDCCVPIEEIQAKGVTLPTLDCLARCNGALVGPTLQTDLI